MAVMNIEEFDTVIPSVYIIARLLFTKRIQKYIVISILYIYELYNEQVI